MTADITAALEQVREWEKVDRQEVQRDDMGLPITIEDRGRASDAYLAGVKLAALYHNTSLKLVEALVVQWEANHATECRSGWPYEHECLWPLPEVLTEFAKEVERLR